VLRVINGILVAALLCAAFWLYQLEYQARVAEDQIRGLKRQIQSEYEAIRLLRAEWAHLSRPQRIEELARKHLPLAPLKAQQIVSAKDLVKAIPEYDRFRKPEEGDPIASLLEGLE
jgi:cell division protein FtsL